jgi:hypothetical protein
MMKKILFMICLFIGITVCTAQDGSLNVPQEYEKVGQKMSDGFEYMLTRMSEYVKAADKVSKADIDSVSRVAMVEFSEKAFTGEEFSGMDSLLKKMLLNDNNGSGVQDSIRNPEQQALIAEIMSVAQKFNPKDGLSKLANDLGEINRKAAKTLSEADATAVYAVSTTGYYSAKYWTDMKNVRKWQAIGKKIKKKN